MIMLKRKLLVTCLLSLLLVSICPNALAQAWSVTGNNGTGCNTTPCANFLGTTDNSSFEIHVDGQRAYRIEPATDTQSGYNLGFSPNVIGGFSGNAVTGTGVAGATIAGGGAATSVNTVSASFGTVGGGYSNTASGKLATVGGGYSSTASGERSTVSGGLFNKASGLSSTVGGGNGNTADGGWSTVAGGEFNAASGQESTLGGGRQNTASGSYSTVGGGAYNTATNYFSAVGGGAYNTATNYFSAVGGGWSNTASGTLAVVGGGYSNTASGYQSTVPGGQANIASGDSSLAAGCAANTNNQAGAFVWADGVCEPLNAIAPNQFLARATGGVEFITGFQVCTIGPCTQVSGVQVAAGGGSWSSISDRNVKDHFAPVDKLQFLARVLTLPITTWNYKTQVASIRHIGPMAQDFFAAFNVGEDDRHITDIDEGGVALAAIQGLNQKLQGMNQKLEEELRQKDARMAAALSQKETRLAAAENEIHELKIMVQDLVRAKASHP